MAAGFLFLSLQSNAFAEESTAKPQLASATDPSAAQIQQLEAKLKANPDFPKSEDASSQLGFGAVMGSKSAVTWLLDHGTPVTPGRGDKTPPLHFAVYGGHEEIAQLLIDRGADVNAAAHNGSTALHLAMHTSGLPLFVQAALPTVSMIDLLLKAGARIEARDAQGRTALHGASGVKDPKVVEHLIEKGAEVDSIDAVDRTPLHRAAEADNAAAVKVLLAHGGKPDAPDKQGWTPLQLAAFNRREALVQLLLPANGAPDLFVSIATAQQKRVVEILDTSPALIDRKHAGWSPLHWAYQTRHPEMAALLIDRGADVNATGGDELVTPLLMAISNGVDIAGLVAHHANVNAANRSGDTPLSYAVSTLDPKLVRTLLATHADVNAKAGSLPSVLCTVASYASGTSKPAESLEILKMLLASHPKRDVVNEGLREAARGRLPEMIPPFIAAGAEPNAGAGTTWTALHYAVRERFPQVVAELLKGGADPNAKDQNGDTPLLSSITAIRPNPEIVRLLLDHGGDPLLKSRNDRNAIELAEFNQRPELAAVIQTFLAEKSEKKKL